MSRRGSLVGGGKVGGAVMKGWEMGGRKNSSGAETGRQNLESEIVSVFEMCLQMLVS